MTRAGLLALGSTGTPRLPTRQFTLDVATSSCRNVTGTDGQWLVRSPSPITAAGPRRIRTVFPILPGGQLACRQSSSGAPESLGKLTLAAFRPASYPAPPECQQGVRVFRKPTTDPIDGVLDTTVSEGSGARANPPTAQSQIPPSTSQGITLGEFPISGAVVNERHQHPHAVGNHSPAPAGRHPPGGQQLGAPHRRRRRASTLRHSRLWKPRRVRPQARCRNPSHQPRTEPRRIGVNRAGPVAGRVLGLWVSSPASSGSGEEQQHAALKHRQSTRDNRRPSRISHQTDPQHAQDQH